MKTLFFIFSFFFVPFLTSAQSGCNSDFNYTIGNCPSVIFFDNSTGSPQPFGGEADIVTRIWSFGDGATSNSTNPTHQYQANGTYNVCLTIFDASGCSDQFCTIIQITCIQQCEAMFQYTTGLCPSILFSDNSYPGVGAQVVSWSWNFGDGTAGTGPNPLHVYQANGTYNVCLTIATSDGCVSDSCTTVEINCISQCEAMFQFTTGLCPTIVFADNSTPGSGAQIVSWNWDFGDGTTGTGPSQTHEYTANGTYTVCLVIETSDGCVSDYCTTVEIDCMVGLSETGENTFTLYPNPVTDYFTIDLLQSSSISYRIIGVNGVEYGHGDFKSSTSHTIDVRFLKQGIYLIEFEVNGQRNSERFIKM
jgi:PKD repeat protein